MAVRSMTGFGQASGGNVEVRIKSVNNRSLDPHWRLPPAWEPHEARLMSALRPHVHRGRLDIYIDAKPGHVRMWLRQRLIPAVFGDACLATFETALAEWNAMRTSEGAQLAADISARLGQLDHWLGQAETAAAAAIADLRQRPSADPQGTGLAAERGDVTEELVRLRSHLAHARALLAAGGEVGRKLDFLAQELNREASTLLAKPTGASPAALRLAELGLDMKAAIEKIREQAQNLE